MRSLTSSTFDAVLEAGEAMTDSAVTITHRMPILIDCLVSPSAEGLAEWYGAAAEKMAAGWDGTIAMWSAWQVAATNAVFAPPTPFGLATSGLALARAAAAPAQRRAHANAIRLSSR